MAGDFDDLIPNSGRPAPSVPTGGGDFADLIPTAPDPNQQRLERLRTIARSTLPQDPGSSDIFGDAYTLGLKKPVQGLAGMLGGELSEFFGGEPATMGERWSANTGAYQDYLDEAQKNSGGVGTAAGLAGSVLTGAPARNVVTSTAPKVWNAVKSAAGYGAVEGAARNSEDLGSAALGAAGGGAAGGVTGGILSAGAQVLPGFRARREAARTAAKGTPPDVLKDQSRAMFKQLDEAGVAYNNKQSIDFADDLISDLKQNGWSPEGVHAPLNGIIKQIADMRGQPMSLEKLQMLREQLGSEAGGDSRQVRRIAGRMLQHLDGFVNNVTPAMSMLPPEKVGSIWKEARQLWRSANVAEDIGWQVRKAERRAASTNSGQNEENAIRQNIRSSVDRAEKPGKYNPYNPAEIEQMDRVVEGTGPQNAMRTAGNWLSGIQGGTMATLAPATSGFTGMLDPQTAMALTVGGPVIAQGAGRLLKGQSANIAQDEADTLMRLISTGSSAPLPLASGPPSRQDMARLMAGQQVPTRLGIGAAGWLTGQ